MNVDPEFVGDPLGLAFDEPWVDAELAADIAHGFALLDDIGDVPEPVDIGDVPVPAPVDIDIAAGFAQVPNRRRQARFHSKWHRMEFVRSQRALKLCERRHIKNAVKFKALSLAWNKAMGLRAGDRVLPAAMRLASSNHKHKPRLKSRAQAGVQPHSNQWDISHTVIVGFSGVGRVLDAGARHCADEVGKAHGGNNLAALTSIAALSLELQHQKVDQWVEQVVAGEVKSIFLASHYDATPVHVAFGVLADAVMPTARYLHFDEDASAWKALPVHKFVEVSRRSLPRRGVVELLAQQFEVHWHVGTGTQHRKIVVLP